MNIDPDLLDDDLSSAMGTETLVAHDLRRETLLKSGYTGRKRKILLSTNSAGILYPVLLSLPLRDLIL